MSAVYLNATTAVVSVVIAFLILGSPYTWLLYYAVFTSIVTAIMFIFKKSLIKTQVPGLSDSGNIRSQKRTFTWKTLPIFIVLIACLFVPLLLAGFLDPYIWFILLVSFASGVSTSEVILYLHTR